MNIDINCDLGEGETKLDCERDARLMAHISRCNIACGAHAGNELTMKLSVENAIKNNLKIGAHPGYSDLENFGRVSLEITFNELKESLINQINELQKIASQSHLELDHIKFHGALYNDIENSAPLAKKIADFAMTHYPTLSVICLADGLLMKYCLENKLSILQEAFIDRRYLANKKLSPRTLDGSVIESHNLAIEQGLSIACQKPFKSIDNQWITIKADTLCLHGDNNNSLEIAYGLNKALLQGNLLQQGSQFNIRQNGDSAVTLIFADQISEALTKKILFLKNAIAKSTISTQLIDSIPAYQSLTLYFNMPISNFDKIKDQLSDIVNTNRSFTFTSKSNKAKLIRIPVCYENDYAPDLRSLASSLKITPNELIEKHTSKTYLVHMLGFLPGFLYLGGLDKSLHYPRKNTPAIKINKGSVGIGGQQTGIYPIDSPGGWHIIGRTPLNMFNSKNNNPTIAEPLDVIEFYPITSKKFLQLEIQN